MASLIQKATRHLCQPSFYIHQARPAPVSSPLDKKTQHRRLLVYNQDPGAALVEVASTIRRTGVPLLEELLQLSVPDAVSYSMILVGRAVVGVTLGTLVLGAVHARLCKAEKQRIDFHPLRSPMAALAKPALVLLPYYGLARTATVLSALAQVAASKMRPKFDTFMRGNGDVALTSLKWITQLLQDTSELVLIMLAAWTICRCKDRAISALGLRIQQEAKTTGGHDDNSGHLVRLLDGAGSMLSWGIWIAALFVALEAYGVNAAPLLASLGASSIVVGIAAQRVLANFVAGLSLFASSVFTVGDRVRLISPGGNTVVEGTVQAVAPSRTVIRAEDGALVYVNNSDVCSMLVRNESQGTVAAA